MVPPYTTPEDVLMAFLRKHATIELTAEPDDTPVRGNAMASGDEAVDREYEDSIIVRRGYGDVWAWATVKVTARYESWEGADFLGGCTYESEEHFKRGNGYYPSMVDEALMELARDISEASNDLDKLARAAGLEPDDLAELELLRRGDRPATNPMALRVLPETTTEDSQ